MAIWLVDTNVLLRALFRGEPEHGVARDSGRILRVRGETLVVTLQGLAEFWNVSTRPRTARGGAGVSVEETHRMIRLIMRQLTFLPDTEEVRDQWQQLVVQLQVRGVQVYDARLVASMLTHGATHLLTFNGADFYRYPQITVVHPQEVVDGTA
jgi:predicted nucleic acid-binding protein